MSGVYRVSRPNSQRGGGRWPLIQRRAKSGRPSASSLAPRISPDAVAAVGRSLGISTLEDWYNVTKASFVQHGGQPLLDQCRNSVPNVLMLAFPTHDWHPWRFSVGVGFDHWGDLGHQRQFLHWLHSHLGLKSMEDWYTVPRDAIRKNYGASVLRRYDDSAFALLTTVYADHPWEPWRFRVLPQNWWNEKKNQVAFLNHARTTHGLKSIADLANLDPIALDALGGKPLLDLYSFDMVKLLSAVFPKETWLPWDFKQPRPLVWWRNRKNLVRYFEHKAEELGLKELSGWYQVKSNQLPQLPHQLGTIHRALEAAYPKHTWDAWRFEEPDWEKWTELADKSRARQAAEALKGLLTATGEKLSVTQYADWYRVSRAQLGLSKLRIVGLFGGLGSALRLSFPQHNWELDLFASGNKRSIQRMLHELLEVWTDHSKKILEEASFISSHKGRSALELDLLIEGVDIAVEYEGVHHYFDVLLYGDRVTAEDTDIDKAWRCSLRGISIVEVPYWWDQTYPSLQSSLDKVARDKGQAPPSAQSNKPDEFG